MNTTIIIVALLSLSVGVVVGYIVRGRVEAARRSNEVQKLLYPKWKEQMPGQQQKPKLPDWLKLQQQNRQQQEQMRRQQQLGESYRQQPLYPSSPFNPNNPIHRQGNLPGDSGTDNLPKEEK